jgi:hypothetical protein
MDEEAGSTLFERAASHFAMVAARRPDLLRVHDLTLAGARVRVEILGPELARRLLATFTHLPRPPDGFAGHPDLTIALWDDQVAEARATRGDFGEPDLAIVERVHGGNLLSARAGAFLAHWTPHGLTMLDLPSRRIVGWIDEAAALTQAEVAKPLLPLLFPWLVSRDQYPVHAGCVAKGDRGVLLGGPGGSGKTTSSLAAAIHGLDFLADDYLALEETPDGRFHAHSLYGAAWLEKSHSRRLPIIAAAPLAADEPNYAKRPFDTARALTRRLGVSTTIEALLLPRLAPTRPTVLRPARKAEALARVGADAILNDQWFASAAQALPLWRRVVSKTPCYWLDLGQDIEGIGPAISDGLDRIREVSGRR